MSRGPGLGAFVAAGVAGAGLLGLLIARLTLSLNTHLYENPRDPILLLVYFGIGYGLVGAVLGFVGGLSHEIVSRLSLPEAARRAIASGILAGLFLGPLLYFAVLPDVGAMPGLLSGLIFGGESRLRFLGTILAIGLVIFVIGQLLALVLHGAARRFRASEGALLRGVVALALALVVLATFLGRPSAGSAAPVRTAAEPVTPLTPGLPPRCVLICIDGLDMDDMVLPMAARGELPTFSRLMQEGTWGPLETIEPTLSSVVWTTLITGKRPDQHGIRHFIVFRLPGLSQSIHQFPRHTGLNFRVFPQLEKLPGVPPLQAPYTSNMRETEALWGIVGQHYPVGAWRWLVSWPVEPVNGFNVAGGVGWLQIMGEFEHQAGHALEQGFHYPRDVYSGLPAPPHLEDVTADMLEPYVGKGFEIPTSDWRLKAVAAALRDPTNHYLPRLIEKFDARFTAASFYPVDEFCHYFTVHRNKGGIFSDAVAERYRFTDARLGEFLSLLGDSVNVIVVSDHGYNFEQNHHTDKPAGGFLAMGPAFDRGRRVESLNVYDVAPLCLYLLNLPLPEDMPGTASGGFKAALPGALLAQFPPGRTSTYETGRRHTHDPVESPIDEQIKDQLRSLGYIN